MPLLPVFTYEFHSHFTHTLTSHRLLRNTAVSTVGASAASRTSITQVHLKMMYNKASWSLKHSSTSSCCIAMTQCYHWTAGCSTQRHIPYPWFQASQEQILNLKTSELNYFVNVWSNYSIFLSNSISLYTFSSWEGGSGKMLNTGRINWRSARWEDCMFIHQFTLKMRNGPPGLL